MRNVAGAPAGMPAGSGSRSSSGSGFASGSALPPSWRYDPASSARDLRLDLLRGLCLLKMVLNHLWATPLHVIHQWTGLVSAAEGFFFLSGVVVAVVHGGRAASLGLERVARGLALRAGQLYIANLGLVFLLAAFEARGLVRNPQILPRLRAEGWWTLFDLEKTYYLHILPRYAVLLLLAPVALSLLRRGGGATALLAAASGALWLANLVASGALHAPWIEGARGAAGFPLASWQVLFVAGMILGFHRRTVSVWWERSVRPRTMAALAAVVVAGVWCGLALRRDGLGLGHATIQFWFDRDLIGVATMANLAAAFAFAFTVADRCWAPIARATGAFLLPLGQQALRLYLLHVVVIWSGVALLASRGVRLDPQGSWWALPIVLAALAGLWWTLRQRLAERWIPN